MPYFSYDDGTVVPDYFDLNEAVEDWNNIRFTAREGKKSANMAMRYCAAIILLGVAVMVLGNSSYLVIAGIAIAMLGGVLLFLINDLKCAIRKLE